MANAQVVIPGASLPVDQRMVPIQTPTVVVFQDATATPVVSPKTSLGTTPLALTVPTGAINVVFYASAAGRWGNNSTLDGSGSGKGYMPIPATTMASFPVAGMSTIYVRAETSTITLSFQFELLA